MMRLPLPALAASCLALAVVCTPGIRAEGLLGGLWSETELVVDPRKVARTLPAFLAERYGVHLRYAVAVHAIEPPLVRTAQETWKVAER
jgi:glycine/D-amino acid oxidase-like deaminating enzyme